MCEWSSSGGDGPSIYREQHRKARNDHACYECGGKISRGETYVYISGVWEGRGDNFACCIPCNLASRAFIKEHLAAHDLGGLDEALSHCLDEETTYDDDDNEVITEAGKRWRAELDAMAQRREKALAASFGAP